MGEEEEEVQVVREKAHRSPLLVPSFLSATSNRADRAAMDDEVEDDGGGSMEIALSSMELQAILDVGGGGGFQVLSSLYSPTKMLSFAGRNELSGESSLSSSSLTSAATSISNSRSSNKKATTATSKTKKPRTRVDLAQASSTTIRVRKEKLGERIAALQQLVSPFGKSDTASVLHEALGYIRFLHDQVQVLSSPYLQGQQPPVSLRDRDRASDGDLRGRGLCLVPVTCTQTFADACNGADIWSPASPHRRRNTRAGAAGAAFPNF